MRKYNWSQQRLNLTVVGYELITSSDYYKSGHQLVSVTNYLQV